MFFFYIDFSHFIVPFSVSILLCPPPIYIFSHLMSYSRNNSATQADYAKTPKSPQIGGGVPFKPVPPPKPKNYRPPIQGGGGGGVQPPLPPNNWENGAVSLFRFCHIPQVHFLVKKLGTNFATITEWFLLSTGGTIALSSESQSSAACCASRTTNVQL